MSNGKAMVMLLKVGLIKRYYYIKNGLFSKIIN